MRLGLVSFYSFRPHVEHLYYISSLLKEAGHELFFLTCDSALKNCYARTLKGTSKLTECLTCVAGGVRSFPVSNISSIKQKNRISLSDDECNMIVSSSISTLLRTETHEDTYSPAYKSLREIFHGTVETVYGNAVDWIEANRLDGIVCFNGRMEVTRAITYACERLAISYLTFERPWFSDGLHFIPQENCLLLKEVDRLSLQYRDIPLTERQARRAAQLVASRFVRANHKEWRVYNLNPTHTEWPSNAVTGPKVLILPSSRNEIQGHPDYIDSWSSYTEGFEWVLDVLEVPIQNVVLRCHPNWGEKIGLRDGSNSENYYAFWAASRGIYSIGSKETASTFDLIQDCDILLVNGSTAAFEAGASGKKIICLGHSAYQEAGIAVHLNGKSDYNKLKHLESHDPTEVIRRTLRYGYTMARRFAQYVDYVQAISPTRYRYFAGADPDKIVQALQSGFLEADDTEIAPDDKGETKILSLIMEKRWDEISAFGDEMNSKRVLDIGRRWSLRWLDGLREKLPRGDRWHDK